MTADFAVMDICCPAPGGTLGVSGLETAPEVMKMLFDGSNHGKPILKIYDEI